MGETWVAASRRPKLLCESIFDHCPVPVGRRPRGGSEAPVEGSCPPSGASRHLAGGRVTTDPE
eukprot:6436271-Alexandrium_andersonii.AAC.1